MNLFTRLPITLTSSIYPVIPESDIEYLTDFEVGSYDHWIFNRGSAVDLVGRKAGKALTPQSDAPTYGAGYLSLSNLAGKGLLSNLQETATGKYTVCAVVREPVAGSTALRVPFGTLDMTAGGTGGMPFMSGAANARKLYTAYTGLGASIDTGQAVPNASWLFIAASFDASVATKQLRTLIGGTAGNTQSPVAAYTASPRAVALGNGYYTGGVAGNLDFADFILFDRALSMADLQAVYVRRKAKLAVGGIAVV
jgi:hypothetical protein